MTRIFFLYVLPLLLPTVIYILWVKRDVAKNPDARYRIIPLPLLLVTGVILAAVVLGIFTLERKAPPDSTYVRAKYEDGKVVPARMEEQ